MNLVASSRLSLACPTLKIRRARPAAISGQKKQTARGPSVWSLKC